MKNVTLDRTTVLQLDADGTDGALDATADCDVLRNDGALDLCDMPIRRSEARNSPLIRPKTCAGPLHSMLPTIDIPEPMQERVAACVVGSHLAGSGSTTKCCCCTTSAAFAATSLSFSGALLLNISTSRCPRHPDPIPTHKSGKARIGKRPDQEPRGGQECKQDSEDDPDINAHQSSPAAALPTNSSLTDRIYFDDLVAQAPERKPVPSGPRHCRDVAHCANRIGTDQTVFVLISTRGATRSPQRSLPCVGYLVQDVLHAWGLR